MLKKLHGRPNTNIIGIRPIAGDLLRECQKFIYHVYRAYYYRSKNFSVDVVVARYSRFETMLIKRIPVETSAECCLEFVTATIRSIKHQDRIE